MIRWNEDTLTIRIDHRRLVPAAYFGPLLQRFSYVFPTTSRMAGRARSISVYSEDVESYPPSGDTNRTIV
jgi:hypothetical protein